LAAEAELTWQDGAMADRYRTPDGWTVEVVQLATGNRLRIRHHGFYVESSGIAVNGRELAGRG
jgi:hypothetical protein